MRSLCSPISRDFRFRCFFLQSVFPTTHLSHALEPDLFAASGQWDKGCHHEKPAQFWSLVIFDDFDGSSPAPAQRLEWLQILLLRTRRTHFFPQMALGQKTVTESFPPDPPNLRSLEKDSRTGLACGSAIGFCLSIRPKFYDSLKLTTSRL